MAANSYVLGLTVRRIIPFGLFVGAGMETFMYYTGFWKTATKNAATRELETKLARQEAREARVQRNARLHGSLGLGDGAVAEQANDAPQRPVS